MDTNETNFPIKTKRTIETKLVAVLAVVLITALVFTNFDRLKNFLKPRASAPQTAHLIKFTSENEFKNYLAEADKLTDNLTPGVSVGIGESMDQKQMILTPTVPSATSENGSEAPRYSETNVQVLGIDEPDIVKNNGENIFYSSTTPLGIRPLPADSTKVEPNDSITRELIQPSSVNQTHIYSAFPIDKLAKLSNIDTGGNLLITNNRLIIINQNKLVVYNITNLENPQKAWNVDFDDDVNISAIRLYNNKLIVLTQKTVINATPCPVDLSKQSGLNIACSEIYHPQEIVPFDSTFTLLAYDAENGEINNKISFTGAANLTVSYFSKDNAYITYTSYKNIFNFMAGFFYEDGKDIFGQEFADRVKNLEKIDISLQAKMTELQVLMQETLNQLSADDALKVQNNMQNALNSYTQKHIREQEVSTIIKININKFDVQSAGSIPGRPLNQFSLDEYMGDLRIATTVGMGSFGSGQSLNDVYVLDQNLKQIGQVQGLAQGENIYSVRFIGDLGYIVTFKQTDPFFVIDLSDSRKPKVVGQLKIPGNSSYLHPLDEGMILGVGMEGSKVKLSVFDVRDSTNPIEISKYNLDEYWTEVNNNHKAFLQDKENKIFFIPGGKGGYVFSYKSGNIKLLKAIEGQNIKRAAFINNYLYVLSDEKLIVLDEKNWQTVSELNN